jgi:ataxin-3
LRLEALAAMIYFERQTSRLCGVHAINALLQGPFFSASDLAAIARALDDEERSLLDQSSLRRSSGSHAERSENVGDDGNFSIQVLCKALDVFGLSARYASADEERGTDAAKELAFVCNLSEHWFALRRLGDAWWDLNSMHAAPKKIGTFYLDAFLNQLTAEGYSIFVVRDLAAAALPEMLGQNGEYGEWLTEEECLRLTSEAETAQASGRARLAAESAMKTLSDGPSRLVVDGGVASDVVDLTADRELQAALEASMEDYGKLDASGTDTDADLKAVLAASLEEIEGGDASIEAAIAASLRDEEAKMDVDVARFAEEPDAGDGIVSLAFRLPDGDRIARRFACASSIADVEKWLEVAKRLDMRSNCLALAFPPRALADASTSIRDAGITDREVLAVRPRP